MSAEHQHHPTCMHAADAHRAFHHRIRKRFSQRAHCDFHSHIHHFGLVSAVRKTKESITKQLLAHNVFCLIGAEARQTTALHTHAIPKRCRRTIWAKNG